MKDTPKIEPSNDFKNYPHVGEVIEMLRHDHKQTVQKIA
jgi:hypothetical protein